MDYDRKEALTRLTRLCQVSPQSIKYLKQALHKDLNALAIPALKIAKETGNPIGDVLAECLKQAPQPLSNDDIFLEMSDISVSLVDVNVVIVKSILDRLEVNSPDNWKSIADFSGFYAKALLNIGKPQEALNYAQKGACLYLRNTSFFDIESLEAFSVYAYLLVSVEQVDTALIIQQESLNTYKTTGQALSSSYFSNYISCLIDLCKSYNNIGKIKKAISYGEEAYKLTKNIPVLTVEDQFVHHSLMQVLADCYEKANKLEQASDLLLQCLEIARDLYSVRTKIHNIMIIKLKSSLLPIEDFTENGG